MKILSKISSHHPNLIIRQYILKPSVIRNRYCTIPETPSNKPKKPEEALKQSGILGRAGTPQEEGYFYDLQKKELKRLKDKLKNEAKKDPGDQK